MITSKWFLPGEDCGQVCAFRAAFFGNPAPDGVDALAWHLMLFLDGEAAACGRLIFLAPGRAQLDNIAVLEPLRRQGIGDGLIKILIYKCEMMELYSIEADVPDAARNLASRLGFKPVEDAKSGEVVRMRKEVPHGQGENSAHQCSCC